MLSSAKATRTRDKALVRLLAETGCTLSEARQLKKGDILGASLTIHANISRDGKTRKLHISAVMAKELSGLHNEFLFSGTNGRILSGRRIQQIVSQATGMAPSQIRAMYISEHGIGEAGLGKYSGKEAVSLHLIDQLRFASKRDELIFRILRETGCRLSELVHLQKQHCSEERIEFSGRQLRISRILGRLIAHSDGPYVVSGKNACSPRRIQQIVGQYSARLGHSITPRIIRNSMARELKQLGRTNEEIAYIMGCKEVNHFTHGI